jgi:hypothetical protein
MNVLLTRVLYQHAVVYVSVIQRFDENFPAHAGQFVAQHNGAEAGGLHVLLFKQFW